MLPGIALTEIAVVLSGRSGITVSHRFADAEVIPPAMIATMRTADTDRDARTASGAAARVQADMLHRSPSSVNKSFKKDSDSSGGRWCWQS